MTPTEMTALLAVHSARAEPVIPEGWQVPNGYILHGPRGRKGCVFVDANGNINDQDVKLWCDFTALADAGVSDRQKRRLAKR